VPAKFKGALVALAAVAGIAFAAAPAAFAATVPAGTQMQTAQAYFDSVFAELAKLRSAINTPSNREKLRDIGWSLLNMY
jgi:hypothetical protein